MYVIMDERLVHAQILYHWCKANPIEEIWLLSPQTCQEPLKKMLIDAMMPESLNLCWILSREDMKNRYDQCTDRDKVLILVESLHDLYSIVEMCQEAIGIISNMLSKKGRAKTILGLYMSPEELSFGEQMLSHNRRFCYQPLPDFEPQMLTEYNLRNEEV